MLSAVHTMVHAISAITLCNKYFQFCSFLLKVTHLVSGKACICFQIKAAPTLSYAYISKTRNFLFVFVAFLNFGFLTWTYYDLKTLTCVMHEYKLFSPKTHIKKARWHFAYHDCSPLCLWHHPGAMDTSLVAHVCVHTCALTHTPSSALKKLRTLYNFMVCD